jgi:protease-4
MSLNADTLLDRMRLKQQLGRWRMLAILVALFAVWALFEKGSQFSPMESDYIARITVDSVITDDPALSKLIEKTRKDRHAKAVLVWLDTPGGSAVGGQQLYLDLLNLSKAKPVVAVMRTMATSAGYMAALGADHIVAREGTVTGSIGVIMESFEATELAEKLGIKPIVIKSGPNKASPNPMEKFTPDQQAVMQGVIQDFFNWFVDIVAERRNLPRDTVVKLADGRIYTGRQALKVKLIDQLGGEKEALQWLQQNRKISNTLEVKDVKVEKEQQSLFDELSQMANGNISAHFLQKLDGLSAIWQPNSL